MMLRILGIAVAGLSLAAAPAALAGERDDHAFTIKNATGKQLACAVKKDGSSRTQTMLIKADSAWTARYGDSKDRRVRCEGTYSQWQRISAGRSYAVLRAQDGRLTLRGE